MTVKFRLPDLGEGLDEAEVVSWLVRVGDQVAREQPLAEVQTDKATVEVPSPAAGVVTKLGCEAGDRIAVGDIFVVIEDGAVAPTGAPAPAAPVVAAPAPTPTPAPVAPAVITVPTGPRAGRAKAAPAVRKLAVELGVDLQTVAGSGPGGRVLAEDVRRLAEGGAPAAAPAVGVDDVAGTPGGGALGPGAVVPLLAPPPVFAGVSTNGGETVVPSASRPGPAWIPGQLAPGRHPLRGIRRRTAEVMAQSWSTIPHITVMDEIDATGLLDARRALKDGDPAATGDLTLASFLVLAVARAARRFPLVNASLDLAADGGNGEIVVHADVHVGLAVATEQGLVVPVVQHADRRGIVGVAAEVARLSAAARAGRLAPSDLTGGTISVTNYGTLGGRFATPLIKPPEAVIFGFGAIAPRPFVLDGAVVARPTLPVVLSADHRLVDGDLASALLQHLCGLLAAPVRLLVEV